MVMDAISGGPIGEGMDTRIIPVSQYANPFGPQDIREEISGPKHGILVGFTGPGIVRVTIQAMHKDNIDLRILTRAIDLGQADLIDTRLNVRHGRGGGLRPW